MAVPVTVIIPTHNWSAALRVSIASAVAQSFPDFELLVVGDACTDDSADVAASFRDPRIRWHNLEARCGSQSGPNNYGLQAAQGRVVAYLGHDDVWHPDHLQSLLDTQAATGAEIVCSMAILHGPPRSGIRAITGVLVGGEDRADAFYPPTSMLHEKSLVDRIGPWRMPDELASPVDCEFLARARAHGARVAGTGTPTAFKFNAAWRRDSYRRRDVRDQRALLERLAADAAGTTAEELIGVVRAVAEKRLIDVRMPDTAHAKPGGHYRANLRARGLADDVPSPLTGRRRFTLDDQASALDWHGVEHHPDWGTFRWSGPSPVSTAVLPVRPPRRFRLSMQVLNWFHVDVAPELTLAVNDQPIHTTVVAGDTDPALRLEALVTPALPPDGPLRLQLSCARMRSPYFLQGSADERWLGACVNWVELSPDDEA